MKHVRTIVCPLRGTAFLSSATIANLLSITWVDMEACKCFWTRQSRYNFISNHLVWFMQTESNVGTYAMSHQGIHSSLSVGDVHSLSNCWTYSVVVGAWNMSGRQTTGSTSRSWLCTNVSMQLFCISHSRGSSQSHRVIAAFAYCLPDSQRDAFWSTTRPLQTPCTADPAPYTP